MSVLKVIEVLSCSNKSWEDAAKNGVVEANKTLKGIKSAWVKDQSLTVKDGNINEYRVTLKVSFEIE
ncbi:MAG TPA: dodecin family protein [Edaphocola sp.]|nr:dodecin family protein [Edaphocola sp.]